MRLNFIIIVIFVCALIIFVERAFPFVLFSKTNPPKIIKIIQKFIPTMVISCLLVYCLKDVTFTDQNGLYLKGFIPSFSALFVTLGLQLWKKKYSFKHFERNSSLHAYAENSVNFSLYVLKTYTPTYVLVCMCCDFF